MHVKASKKVQRALTIDISFMKTIVKSMKYCLKKTNSLI